MPDPVFFPQPDSITLREIADLTGVELHPTARPEIIVSSLAPLSAGGTGALVFAEGRRNAPALAKLSATAAIVTEDLVSCVPDGIAILVTARPQFAFNQVAQKLFPAAMSPGRWTGEAAISAAAIIDPSARLEPGVIVEAGAVISADVAIGFGTVIAPNAVVGRECRIGRNSHIGSSTSIRNALIGDHVIVHDGVRIGQDGFGYLPGPGGLEKVPQLGRVIIQNHVEIGANTTIDRGALEDTVIGEGTKIDNLVQIAHNVKIGRQCAIAAHCGISGSVTIGDGVMLGGLVGIANHVKIGDGAQIAATSGVMNEVPPGEKWGGAPAKPLRTFFREMAALKGLANPKKKDNGSD